MRIYKTPSYRAFQIFNVLLMISICFLILYPLYYMLIISFSNGSDVLSGNVRWYPMGITTRAYRAILRDGSFVGSYKNTIIITLLGTTVNLIMTTLAAYPLSRRDLMGRKFMMKCATFTMFFTGGMIPNYLLVTSLKLHNSYWAIVIPGAISVYNMIIMRTFFEGLPVSLSEAAYIDGASDIGILLRIVVPLSKPIFLTMILFYAVGHWNGYFSALLYLNDETMYPIQLFVRKIVLAGETLSINMAANVVAEGTEHGMTMLAEQSTKYAIVILSILPILIVYPIISKYFKSGVMIGAIKE